MHSGTGWVLRTALGPSAPSAFGFASSVGSRPPWAACMCGPHAIDKWNAYFETTHFLLSFFLLGLMLAFRFLCMGDIMSASRRV